MTTRRAHLVGSLPGANAVEAMELAVSKLGPSLATLPDGETGERRNWIISMIESLRDHPDLELARAGDWSDYDRVPRFRLRRGHRLYAASLDLGITSAAAAARPTFLALRDGLGIGAGPGGEGAAGGEAGPLRFQVGIPGDIDLALFVFGPAGPVRQRRPFTEALAATMYQIARSYGDDVLYQIEIPAEVVLLGRAPARVRPLLAGQLGRQVAALAQGAPPGARFGLHLCLGDMNHQALGHISDASPLVQLTNAVSAHWPSDRTLQYVHLPLAEADAPPATDAAFYRALADLRLGPGVRVIAGFAHEGQDLETQRTIRGLIESAVGSAVDVSHSCGLGRRSPQSAVAALDRLAELLD
jgi:hypothetical protein